MKVILWTCILCAFPAIAAVVPSTYTSLTQLSGAASLNENLDSVCLDEKPGILTTLCRIQIRYIENYRERSLDELEPSASICLSHSNNTPFNSLVVDSKESHTFEQKQATK